LFSDLANLADIARAFRVSEYFCPPITVEVKGVSGACSDTAERKNNHAGCVSKVRELGAEIMTHAKQLRTRNKRFNIIFHIEGDIVVIDKNFASKMIIN